MRKDTGSFLVKDEGYQAETNYDIKFDWRDSLTG
jgi:hypothetical protein